MRKAISITSGCLVAAVLTHGFVSSGTNLDNLELPFFTYRGFFTAAILGAWRLWTQAHGSPSINFQNAHEHGIETFGRLLAIALLLTLPLAGFAVSAISSRERISWQWLRPLAIATILAFWDVLIPVHFYELRHVTTRQIFIAAGLPEEFAEAGRAVVVTLLLLWSVGVLRVQRSRGPEPIRDVVTA